MSQVIEFYRPKKKAKATPAEPAKSDKEVDDAIAAVEDASARAILTKLAQNAGPISEILVIMRMNDDALDFLGNLEDLDQTLMIMEDLKFKIMQFRNPPEGTK